MNEIVTERPNLFEPNVYITVCVEIEGKIEIVVDKPEQSI